MENLKAIVADHVYESLGPFEMLYDDTMIDMRIYIDQDGAHVMMSNVKGDLDK